MKRICSPGKIIAAALLVSVTVLAQTNNAPPLRAIAPDVFQLGSVQLDKKNRAVHFPASVNMANGVVEYFIVTGTGKLHESIFKTETDAAQIHTAMLLLGAKAQETNAASTNIIGDKIQINVSWKISGEEKQVRAEDLVLNTKTRRTMTGSGWVYNASKVIDGTFIAQRDGSIVAIISDPLALANSTQADRDNDDIWFVNTNRIPALNTPVEITFQLPSKQQTHKDAQ